MQSMISSISQKMPFLKPEGVRQALIYFMAIAALFLILILADNCLTGLDTRPHLYGFMAVAVLFGIINHWLLARPLFGNVPEWLKAMLTLTANMTGAVFFMAVSPHSTKPYYGQLMLPALLLFSLPWFFMAAIRALLAIPGLRYAPLQVPDLRDIAGEINWAENEERGIIWKFGVLPEINLEGVHWVRTHTPNDVMNMKLKDLFKGLLSLHNHNLSPGRPIHFKEQRTERKMPTTVEIGKTIETAVSGQMDIPFGWRFFYQKDFFFWKMWMPLDPEKTFRENGVRFHLLSKQERAAIENLRKGLSAGFKTTSIFIKRM